MLTVDIEKTPFYQMGVRNTTFDNAILMMEKLNHSMDEIVKVLNIKKDELIEYIKSKKEEKIPNDETLEAMRDVKTGNNYEDIILEDLK